jgi:hypothetical protein
MNLNKRNLFNLGLIIGKSTFHCILKKVIRSLIYEILYECINVFKFQRN